MLVYRVQSLIELKLLEVFAVANFHILRNFRSGLRAGSRLSEGMIIGALILSADRTLNRVVRIHNLAANLLILKVLSSQFLVVPRIPSLSDKRDVKRAYIVELAA
jgi:hypothetical protein